MVTWPRPDAYSDWKRWASALIKALLQLKTTSSGSSTSSDSGSVGFDDLEGVFFFDSGGS